MDAAHRGRRNAGNQPGDLPQSTIDEPLRSALADSHVVLFTQDLNLRYTWIFNPQLDYATEEVLGKRDEDLFPAHDAAVLTAIKQAVLDSGRAARETVRTSRDGTVAYYDLVVEPWRDQQGVITGVTCAATDITDHRQRADELRFQSTVLETITDAVIAVDCEGRVIYWNQGAGAVFGYSAEEMLGQLPDRLFPSEEQALFPERFATILEGTERSGEWRAVDKLGRTRWVDMSARALRDTDGSIIGVVGVGKDVTERRSVEDEQRFGTTVLESIHDSVIVTDLAGQITYWNRGAEDIFGYRAEEMLGQTLAALYPESDPEEVAADLADIAAGTDYHGEWRGRRKDAEPVWLDIRTTALRDATGAVSGFVGVAKDITPRKQAERQRDRLLRRERTSRRRLRQFLALVAHDLRNPLTLITGYIQVLRRRTLALDSDGYARAVEAIESAASRMERLITDLGDAAAAGEGHFAIQPVPMDLIALVQDVVAEYQAETDDHRLLVKGPDTVEGRWDPMRIQQLLTNLIDNAIKYSPDGGEITVTVQEDGDEVTLNVQDMGIGIAVDEQENLFDLFTRGDETEGIAGFGLGLYICKAIVEAHHGRIGVDSEPGLGSRFSVALPRESQPPLPAAPQNTSH